MDQRESGEAGPVQPKSRAIWVVMGVLAIGLMVVVLGRGELTYAIDTVKVQRYQAKCDGGNDLTACRLAALGQLRVADTSGELAAAKARMELVCEKGEAKACRIAAYISSDEFSHWLGGGKSIVYRDLATLGHQKCLGGDARACGVTAWFVSMDDPGEIAEKSKQLCSAGEDVACLAWSIMLERTEPEGKESSQATAAGAATCKAGYAHGCADKSTSSRDDCYAGDLAACAKAGADADLDREILAALAAADGEGRNPGLYRVKLPKQDFAVACDAGSALACLAAGLQSTEDGTTPDAEPLPSSSKLDGTFGKACDAGLHIACVAHAWRLLDRPVAEKRDVKAANTRLEQACNNGSERGCWLRNREKEIIAGDFASYRKVTERSCRGGSMRACKAFMSMLAFEAGITPWPIEDQIGYARLRRQCAGNDIYSCEALAWMIRGHEAPTLETVVPPFRITAWDAATSACKRGLSNGCKQVIWAAKQWWPERLPKLREKICPAFPAACED